MLHLALSLLALTALGCLLSPGRRVSGTVRYPGGALARHALVSLEPGASTFTNSHWHYSLQAPAEGDTVSVFARDGYFGDYGYFATNTGSARVVVGPDGATLNIVLDQVVPI